MDALFLVSTWVQFEWVVHNYGLFGLFLANVLSASVLPFPSEPVIIAFLNFFSVQEVFVAAFSGSLIGAISNYFIGLKGIHNWFVKRKPAEEAKLKKWFDKYGMLVLIIAPWIPFVGDPFLIVAGASGMELKKFLFWVSAGKIIKISAVIMFGEALYSLYSFI